jgi:hypothetical protein
MTLKTNIQFQTPCGLCRRVLHGIDKEGGFYHEHPVENPLLHVSTEPVDIENFVVQSLEVLKTMNLI